MLYKFIKILIYTLLGALIGFGIAFLDFNIFNISVCLLIQISIFVLVHEFMHGKVAEINGLKFTKLYAGPIIVIRENKRFVRIEKNRLQGTYLGRANIENGEIRNDLEYDRHTIAWKRVLLAGPKSDLALSILFIVAGIYFKLPILILSTLIIDISMCIPSFLYGDGTHFNNLKKDEIFKTSVMYSNSIIGEDGISKETEKYLTSRLEKELEEREITDDNIVSLCIAAQTLLFQKIIEGKYSGYKIEEIIWNIRDGSPSRFKKPNEKMYFRGLINTAVLYYTCIENDLRKAQILFRSIKYLKHISYVEKNDFIRSKYVLGIQDKKEELLSHKYRNPIFKGCKSVEKSEDRMDEIVIKYVDKMGFY